ncbi:MAG: AsmA family protein [Elusimicrobia bacterium]|nr:AsmA family protein [Elusimicrobiota bacterium]
MLKSMKLRHKILLRIIVLPLLFAALLAVTALVTIKTMFKPQDLEAVVTNQLQELFKRPVRIEYATLSLTGEIKIKGLNVIEPDPSIQNFVEADYIYATYRFLPLINKKIEINSLVFVAPKIILLKKKDGTWNLSDIFAAYKSTPKKNRLDKITQAEIKDGTLIIKDQTSPRQYALENVNISLNDFKPGQSAPFSVGLFLKNKTPGKYFEGRLYAEGTVNLADFNWEKASASGLNIQLSLLNKSARITGELKNFRRPEIKLKGELQNFRSSEISALWSSPRAFNAPRTTWDINAVFVSTRVVEVSASVEPLKLKTHGTLDFSSPTFSYAFSASVPSFDLALLKKSGVELPVTEAAGRAQGRISFSGGPQGFNLANLELNAYKNSFAYKNLRCQETDFSALLSGNFQNNHVDFTKGCFTLGKAKLTGLDMKTGLSKELFDINYSGRFNGEPLRGRVTIDAPFTDKKTLAIIGYSSALTYKDTWDFILDLKNLLHRNTKKTEYESEIAWIRKLKNSIPSGFSSFKLLYKTDFFKHDYFDARDFNIAADLKNISGSFEKLKGTVSIKTSSGTFYNVQKTSEQDRVFYIVSMPILLIYHMNRIGALKFGYTLDNAAFNSIGGDYELDSGRVQVKNFFMEGRDFSAHVEGELNFSDETMRLKIYTISSKYYNMGSLPEAMTDSSGKPALAFTIEGKMNKPAINMISPKNSGDIIKAAANKGVGIDFKKLNKFIGGKK